MCITSIDVGFKPTKVTIHSANLQNKSFETNSEVRNLTKTWKLFLKTQQEGLILSNAIKFVNCVKGVRIIQVGV